MTDTSSRQVFRLYCGTGDTTWACKNLQSARVAENYVSFFRRLAGAGSGANGTVIGALASRDRKSTRLNSSHLVISYAVFCLKEKIERQLFHRQLRRLLEQLRAQLGSCRQRVLHVKSNGSRE